MKTTTRILIIAIIFGCLIGVTAEAQSKGKRTTWLGVYTQTVNEDLIDDLDLKLPNDRGVLVTEIVDDSPADEANLREDDVIVEIESRSVNTSKELRSIVRDYDDGDEITLKIIRNNQPKEITLVLGSQRGFGGNRFVWFDHDDDWDHDFDLHWSEHGKSGYFGVTLSSLSDQLGDYFGVDNGRGALITEVELDSPADEAGIKAGDVIVQINDVKIYDPGDVSELVGEMEKGDQAAVVVIRERSKKEITVEAGEHENDFFGSQFDIIAPGVSFGRTGSHSLRFFDRGHSDDHDLIFDDDDFQLEMEKLRKELRQMQKELKDIKDDLQ